MVSHNHTVSKPQAHPTHVTLSLVLPCALAIAALSACAGISRSVPAFTPTECWVPVAVTSLTGNTTTSYEYDDAGNLVHYEYPVGSLSFHGDEVTFEQTDTEYADLTYDENGCPTSYTLSSEAAGELNSFTYENEYDDQGRLVTSYVLLSDDPAVEGQNDLTRTYEYYDDGTIKQETLHRTFERYEYSEGSNGDYKPCKFNDTVITYDAEGYETSYDYTGYTYSFALVTYDSDDSELIREHHVTTQTWHRNDDDLIDKLITSRQNYKHLGDDVYEKVGEPHTEEFPIECDQDGNITTFGGNYDQSYAYERVTVTTPGAYAFARLRPWSTRPY